LLISLSRKLQEDVMRKIPSVMLALVLSASLLPGLTPAAAQTVTSSAAVQGPTTRVVTTLSSASTSALAYTSDGKLLMVADSGNNQIHVLDITTPETPNEISTVDLDGKPVALAAAANFALAAVVVDRQTAFVEVIA